MAAQFKVTFGGWYQRTTLHLTEIYGFLSEGFTKLDLDKEKLKLLREGLNLEETSRQSGYLEYIQMKTKDGIEIRYYEDGLYILELSSDDVKKASFILQTYFEKQFEPAISYLFSLGAPTPKILANIKIEHPIAVGIISDNPDKFKIDSRKFGSIYSQISTEGITVYKTTNFIFVVSKKAQENKLKDIIETHIFFREFKDQLEKYLNIHRNLWEEISSIKERRFIKGSELEDIRSKLDQYQKSINLIDSRIKQMAPYAKTRASTSNELNIEKHLAVLFQYKFETLTDTHQYIQEIWKMTQDYLSTAIEIIKEIQGKSISTNIVALQIITSIGVVSGILGYLAVDSLPSITGTGLIYLFILFAAIWPINFLIKVIYRNQKYKISFPEHTKNI